MGTSQPYPDTEKKNLVQIQNQKQRNTITTCNNESAHSYAKEKKNSLLSPNKSSAHLGVVYLNKREGSNSKKPVLSKKPAELNKGVIKSKSKALAKAQLKINNLSF
jgi:hypothetical protein